MTTTTITDFSKNIVEYVRSAINFNEVIDVTTTEGSAVMMSKEDYDAIVETFRVMSTPGMMERIEIARKTPLEECDSFEW